ncbi:hypothetical protein Tco_0052517 [Tanacetum coccineum]
MGNCIKKQPTAIHPALDDCQSLATSPKSMPVPFSKRYDTQKIENYPIDGGKKTKTEIKIKISKKQLEEVLGRTDVQGLTVEKLLAQLMSVSERFETHERSWRPALQSIPEPPSPRPRPQKEGGVFNRLGGKKRSASPRSDSCHQGSHEKEIEVQPIKHHHRGTSSRETGGYSESEDSEGGHWETRMPSHVKTYDGSGDPKDHLKLFQAATKTERYKNNIQGKLSPTNKTHQGSGGDTSYQAKRWRIHGGLYRKILSRNPGCGRSAGMHEDLQIHARYNPPRADQAFIRENSEVNGRNVQGDYVFFAREVCTDTCAPSG